MTRRREPAAPASSAGIDQPPQAVLRFDSLPPTQNRGLRAVPHPFTRMRDTGGPVPGLNWAGPHDVPAVGARVEVTMNSFGPGTVRGYRTEPGNDARTIHFLFLEVHVDAPPAWFARDHPGEHLIAVTGVEFRPLPI